MIEINRSRNFLPGGNVSRPIMQMNSTYLDQSDYASLQPPATQYPQNMQQFGKDLGQTYASLNFDQNAFDSERFELNLRCFFLL